MRLNINKGFGMRACPIGWELEQRYECGVVVLELEQHFVEYEREHRQADSY